MAPLMRGRPHLRVGPYFIGRDTTRKRAPGQPAQGARSIARQGPVKQTPLSLGVRRRTRRAGGAYCATRSTPSLGAHSVYLHGYLVGSGWVISLIGPGAATLRPGRTMLAVRRNGGGSAQGVSEVQLRSAIGAKRFTVLLCRVLVVAPWWCGGCRWPVLRRTRSGWCTHGSPTAAGLAGVVVLLRCEGRSTALFR